MTSERRHISATRFVLLFEGLRSVHLHKDVGQIPFQLHRHFGFDAEIASFRNEKEYRYINEELNGLRLRFFRFSRYWFLLRNSHRIDALMLFHISTKTIYCGLLYKALNPHGCLYVKADLSSNSIVYPTWKVKNPFTVMKRRILYDRFLKVVDIVSFETKGSFNCAHIPDSRKILVPNGFDPDLLTYFGMNRKEFAEKEDVVLLVARHGDKAKNSEFMLDVLAALGDIGHWKVYFVGPMTADFQKRKTTFLAEHQQFVGSVVFTGPVEDKRELFEYYNRSKILCVTSRSDSWGMVCVEALCFGNALVMTNVNSSADLTDEGKSGVIIEQGNCASYVDTLRRLMNEPETLRHFHNNALYHFNSHFVWKNILHVLADQITGRQSHEAVGQRIC